MKKIIFRLSFLIVTTSFAFAQNNTISQDSLATKPKTKKQIYIENYIANFPYKNTDIYEVIKQRNLWDTTGVVPVINAHTISINRHIKQTEVVNENTTK
jgi:hypothetical protein